MTRLLYYGLAAILATSMLFALMMYNYDAYGVRDSIRVISELAGVYDLDHVSCALDAGYCNIN
jgi:hypothetical protein